VIDATRSEVWLDHLSGAARGARCRPRLAGRRCRCLSLSSVPAGASRQRSACTPRPTPLVTRPCWPCFTARPAGAGHGQLNVAGAVGTRVVMSLPGPTVSRPCVAAVRPPQAVHPGAGALPVADLAGLGLAVVLAVAGPRRLASAPQPPHAGGGDHQLSARSAQEARLLLTGGRASERPITTGLAAGAGVGAAAGLILAFRRQHAGSPAQSERSGGPRLALPVCAPSRVADRGTRGPYLRGPSPG
jgi:hypothetical protein